MPEEIPIPKIKALTKSQRAELFGMFNGHCAYCGTALPVKGWHADHVEPVYRITKLVCDEERDFHYKYVQTGECFSPENNRADNFMPCCRPCNIDKSTLSLEDWRHSLEHKVEVLRNNFATFRHAERFGLVAQIGEKVTFYFEEVLVGRGA